jgi:hypothetical protein
MSVTLRKAHEVVEFNASQLEALGQINSLFARDAVEALIENFDEHLTPAPSTGRIVRRLIHRFLSGEDVKSELEHFELTSHDGSFDGYQINEIAARWMGSVTGHKDMNMEGLNTFLHDAAREVTLNPYEGQDGLLYVEVTVNVALDSL